MKLYKFRSTDNFLFLADMLVSERIYCPKLVELNDPMEGIYDLKRDFTRHDGDYRRKFTISTRSNITYDDIRICCFSSEIKSIQMWAHYGGAHRGLALEYDFSDIKNDLIEVKYDGLFYQFFTDKNENPSPRDILAIKTPEWKYESEYRLMSGEKFLSVEGRLNRVVLGMSFPRETERILRRLAPPNTIFSRVGLDSGNACLSMYDLDK